VTSFYGVGLGFFGFRDRFLVPTARGNLLFLFFIETRRDAASSEPLIGLVAFVVSKL